MSRLSLFFLCVAVLGVSACNQSEEVTPPEQSVQKIAEGPRLLELTTETMSRAELTMTPAGPGIIASNLRLQADVELNQEKMASVVSWIGGIVDQINVKLGQKVKQGEVLAEIKSLELADIKMTYVESEHQLEFLREALAREEKLLEKKITSKEAFLAKKHEMAQAEVAHSKALHRLRLLGFTETYLHDLIEQPDQEKIARMQLRAPINGEIIFKDLMVGKSVHAEQPLFQLADLSDLRIRFHLPIKYLQGIDIGHVVQVECERLNSEIKGTVVHLSSLVADASRTVPVLARIENSNGIFRPGMAVRVTLASGQTELKVAVPRSAVQEVDGQDTIFVQVAPSVFELRSVTLDKSDDKLVEVLHGLKAGEQVVSGNSYRLKAEWFNRSGE